MPCRIAVHGIETVLARLCPALPAHEARIVKLAHTAPPPRAAPSALTLHARRSSNCSFCIKIKPDLSRIAGHADTLSCSSPSAPQNGFFGRPVFLAVLFLTACFTLSSQRLTSRSRMGEDAVRSRSAHVVAMTMRCTRGKGCFIIARCCQIKRMMARKCQPLFLVAIPVPRLPPLAGPCSRWVVDCRS